MPFSSLGCHTCKSRRIKCDETKPTCRRCAKSGRICIDMSVATQTSFEIHFENTYVGTKAKRPRGPRSRLTLLHPHVDMQSRALIYFLNCHIQPVEDVMVEFPTLSDHLVDCILAWRHSGYSSDMVDLGLSALALAIFSRNQKYAPAATEASSIYVRLLKLVRQQIAQVAACSLDQKSIDACLLTALIMNRYEHSVVPIDLQTLWSHYDGAMAILKTCVYNRRQFPLTIIMKVARRTLVWNSLIGNRTVPTWLFSDTLFCEDKCGKILLDRVVIRLAYIRHALERLNSMNVRTVDKMEEWDQYAQEMDRNLSSCVTRMPVEQTWEQHVLHIRGPFPNSNFYSPTVRSYQTLGYAALWSQFSAARMLISDIRLKILDRLGLDRPGDPIHAQQRLECVTQLRTMADFLASSIPFCLERFTIDRSSSPETEPIISISDFGETKPYLGSLVLQPLTIAAGVEEINIDQQKWFRSQLVKVGTVMGNGVLEMADNCPLVKMVRQ